LNKYGKDNLGLVSHSQSGNIAENLTRKGLTGKDNVTLNPAIFGKHSEGLEVVKSDKDLVSALSKTGKNDTVIKSKGAWYNPMTYLKEHSPSIIGRTNKLFGKGIRKKIKGGSLEQVENFYNQYKSIFNEYINKPSIRTRKCNQLNFKVSTILRPSEEQEYMKLTRNYKKQNLPPPKIKNKAVKKDKLKEIKNYNYFNGFNDNDKLKFNQSIRYILNKIKKNKFIELKDDIETIRLISMNFVENNELKRMSEKFLNSELE